jgi:hypothetical protein
MMPLGPHVQKTWQPSMQPYYKREQQRIQEEGQTEAARINAFNKLRKAGGVQVEPSTAGLSAYEKLKNRCLT